MVRIGISGACGKMGQRIASLAAKDPEVKIAAALEAKGNPETGILPAAGAGHQIHEQ